MPKPDGYVEVNERIERFYAKYPNGSLQSTCTPFIIEAGDKPFVVYGAYAYRTPDDPKPAMGWAWEPVPGPTPFTRDSELMNAETSAWGRAIAALGFEVKEGIASAQEVRARGGEATSPAAAPRQESPSGPRPGLGKPITEAQLRKLNVEVRRAAEATGQPVTEIKSATCADNRVEVYEQLTSWQASQLIDKLIKLTEHAKAVPA